MNPRLKRIIDSIDSLPTLPDTAVRLIDLANRDNYQVSDIITIIERDPAIATRVLKVANSPFYGFLGKISSIDHAVTLLGMNELKNIVLASALSIYFGNGKQLGHSSLNNLWKHSVVTAFVARMLGEDLGDHDIASLFLIGLIHDIGFVIMSRYFKEEFSELMEIAGEKDVELYTLEKKIVGASHCEIGALILKNWKLPHKVVLAVLFHHEPWKDTSYPLVSTIIYFADILARIIGFPPNTLERKFEIDSFIDSPGAAMVSKAGFNPSHESIDRLLRRIGQHIGSSNDLSSIFKM